MLQDPSELGKELWRLEFHRFHETMEKNIGCYCMPIYKYALNCITLRPRNLFSTMSIRPIPCLPATSFKRVNSLSGSAISSSVWGIIRQMGLPVVEEISYTVKNWLQSSGWETIRCQKTFIKADFENSGITWSCFSWSCHLIKRLWRFLIRIFQNTRFVTDNENTKKDYRQVGMGFCRLNTRHSLGNTWCASNLHHNSKDF